MNVFELALVIAATDKASQVIGRVSESLDGVRDAANNTQAIDQVNRSFVGLQQSGSDTTRTIDQMSETITKTRDANGRFVRSVEQTSDALEGVARTGERTTKTIDRIRGALDSASKASKGMREFGQDSLIAGAAMGMVGQQIVGGLSRGLNSILAPAERVEDALVKVGSVVVPMGGSIEDAMARAKTAALDWSKAHTDTADKFLDTTYMMISAGLDEAASVEATRTAMLTAKATMGEATEAAALIATAYNNMGDKAAPARQEIGRLGDVITKTQQNFQFANLGQLAAGLTFGIPAAKAAKLGFEELSTTIGALNSAGLAGSMAGTAFANVLSRIDTAGSKLNFTVARASDGSLNFTETLRNMEARFGSLKDMTPAVANQLREAFGDEGFRAVSLMLGKSNDLAASLGAVKNSAGAAATAAALIEGTESGEGQILANRIDAIKVGLADKLNPALQALDDGIFRLVDAVGKWVEQNPEVVQAFADAVRQLGASIGDLVPQLLEVLTSVGNWVKENPALTANLLKMVALVGAALVVLGPLVMMFGMFAMYGGHALNLASGIGKLGLAVWKLAPALMSGTVNAARFAAALLANPITWIVLAIVAAAALIYIYWDPIKAFFLGLWESIKSAGSGAVDWLVSAWQPIASFFTAIWEDIKAGFQLGFVAGVVNALKYFNPLYWIAKAFLAVVTWLASFDWRAIGAAVVDGLVYALTIMNPVYWVTTAFLAVWTWLTSLDWSAIGQRIVDGLMWAIENLNPLHWVMAAFQTAQTWLASIDWTAVGQRIVDGIMGALRTLAGLVSSEFEGVKQLFFTSGSALISMLVQGIQAVASMPVEAMQGVVARVRALLPFSPAKEGPLSDLDRIRLVETIAENVRPAPLVKAMTAVAGAAQIAALPAFAVSPPANDVLPVPTISALPVASERSGNGNPLSGTSAMAPIVQVSITIEGNADAGVVQQLEQWVNGNGPAIHRAVMREEKRQARSKFGNG